MRILTYSLTSKTSNLKIEENSIMSDTIGQNLDYNKLLMNLISCQEKKKRCVYLHKVEDYI